MIVAVPKPDGTFGEGTTYELAFARYLEKITWEYTASEIRAIARTAKYKIIAVDFDGTLCKDCYPDIGEPNQRLIEYLRKRKIFGAKIIL